MYRVIFFGALQPGEDGEQLYGDAGQSYLDLDFRPMVGDLFPAHMIHSPWIAPPWTDKAENVLNTEKGAHAIDGLSSETLYEVEKVLYAGNNVFFAYCVEIEPSEQGRHDLGIRGNTGSLIYHYAEQTHAFHRRHNEPKGKRTTLTTTSTIETDE